MNVNLAYLVSFVGGLGLGLFYFGGLWLTVKRLSEVSRPSLLILGSFLGRLATVLIGFYLLLDGQWEHLVISLLGFMVMRFAMVHHLRPGSLEARTRKALP